MALNSGYYELIWARAKHHEFRRRFVTGTPVSWLVFLTAPTSVLAAVIGLQPAVVDEPRLITDLAVFDFTDAGMVLVELQDGATLEDIEAATEARYTVAPEFAA